MQSDIEHEDGRRLFLAGGVVAALGALLAPGEANAQATGPIPNHTVLGNQTGARALPVPISDAITVNGVAIPLGGSGTIAAAAGTISPGTTTVGGVVHGGFLYDNAGSLAELAPVNNGVVCFTAGGVAQATVSLPAGLNFNLGNPTFSAQTGSGGVVLVSGATLVNPNLGNASATTLNGLTIPSAAGATLQVAAGKTVHLNNGMTIDNLTGVDNVTYHMPTSADTLAGLNTAQTFSKKQVLGASIGVKRVTKSTSYALVAGTDYMVVVSASAPNTQTLPAAPSDGDAYVIADGGNNCTTNPITVAGNGVNFNTTGAGTLTMNTVNGMTLEFVYAADLNLWIVA